MGVNNRIELNAGEVAYGEVNVRQTTAAEETGRADSAEAYAVAVVADQKKKCER